MRAPLLALAAALLALPAVSLAPAAPAEPAGPADQVELSHGFFVPFMHAAALDLAPGIRPGGWVQINGADCTLAFVLRDAAANLYITTAGHCTGPLGQRASLTHDGLVASTAEQVEFGTLVASWPCPEGAAACRDRDRLDAALLRIDADKHGMVNPSMVGWGGPTGLVTDFPAFGTGTLHHGWGWVTWYDQQTRCRRGVLDGTGTYTWWTLEHGGGGDSGSAIMTADGRALGILDWGGGVVVPLSPFGLNPVTGAFTSSHVGGVRLDAVLRAWNNEGWGLELVTGGPVNLLCDSARLPP